MADKVLQHSLNYDGNLLSIRGVRQAAEIGERQAVFRLEGNTLTVRGSGLNVIRLDKEQGVVVLEVKSVSSIVYRQGGLSLKGLFR